MVVHEKASERHGRERNESIYRSLLSLALFSEPAACGEENQPVFR